MAQQQLERSSAPFQSYPMIPSPQPNLVYQSGQSNPMRPFPQQIVAQQRAPVTFCCCVKINQPQTLQCIACSFAGLLLFYGFMSLCWGISFFSNPEACTNTNRGGCDSNFYYILYINPLSISQDILAFTNGGKKPSAVLKFMAVVLVPLFFDIAPGTFMILASVKVRQLLAFNKISAILSIVCLAVSLLGELSTIFIYIGLLYLASFAAAQGGGNLNGIETIIITVSVFRFLMIVVRSTALAAAVATFKAVTMEAQAEVRPVPQYPLSNAVLMQGRESELLQNAQARSSVRSSVMDSGMSMGN